MDDGELVRQALAGRAEALAAIHDRYAARLHDFAGWALGDPQAAAVVVEEAFLLAAARLHQLGDPRQLRAWLFAITRHLVFEEPRRGWPEGPGPAALPSGAITAAGARSELAALIQEAAGALSLRQRALLDLHHRHGLGGDELGAVLGVSGARAFELLAAAGEEADQLLGELCVARLGPRQCPEARDLVAEEGAELTPALRRRAARHADGCPTCEEIRRHRLTAAGLAAAAPALVLGEDVRERVLGGARVASVTGRPWPGRPPGFPPAVDAERDPRWRWPVVAAAAVAVIVLGAVALLTQDGSAERVAAGAATSTTGRAHPTSPTTLGTTSTSAASTTTTTDPGPPGQSGSGPGGTPAPRGTTAPPATGAPPANPPAGGGTTTTTRPPLPTFPTVPTPTSTSSTTTTPPPDRSGPALSGLTVDPNVLRGGAACPDTLPDTTTVTVNAVDSSGVVSVRASAPSVGGGDTTLTRTSGDTFQGTIGPFESPLGPGTPDFETPLVVSATDGAGNTSLTTSTVVLRCS